MIPERIPVSQDQRLDPDYAGVPDYMIKVYDWAYVNASHAERLDHNWVVRALLFGNDQCLMRAYLDELSSGMKVWQVAHVYGDLVQRAARKVGPEGAFHLTDITPAQVRHGERKLADIPWARVWRDDADRFAGHARYDVVCSFFLLHEIPEEKKRSVINHMLSLVPEGGKAVFVDYHKPNAWNPIGWLLRLVNTWLEPFSYALWQNEIHSYAKRAEDFSWRKRTYFGGVYQCVIAQRLKK